MKSKTEKATRLIKTATRILIGAGIVLVFIRNSFPEVKEAVIIEETSSVQTEIPVKEAALPTESSFSAEEKSSVSETSDLPQSSTAESDNSAVSAVSEPTNSDKININKANAGELMRLKGIGETKAAAIMRYRKENGGFKSVDELINVSGIGEKTLANIRDYVTV